MKNTISGNPAKAMMKLLVAADSGKVVGVHMVGPECAEIMQARFPRKPRPTPQAGVTWSNDLSWHDGPILCIIQQARPPAQCCQLRHLRSFCVCRHAGHEVLLPAGEGLGVCCVTLKRLFMHLVQTARCGQPPCAASVLWPLRRSC